MEDKDFNKWLSERADGFTLQPSDGAFDRIMEGLEEKKKRGFAWWFMLLPVLFLGVSAMFYIQFAPSASVESTNTVSLLPLNRMGISNPAQQNRVSATLPETVSTSPVSVTHATSSTGQQVSYANRVHATGSVSASSSSRTGSATNNPAQPETTGSSTQNVHPAGVNTSVVSIPTRPSEPGFPRYETGSTTPIATGFSWREPFIKEVYTPVAKMKRRGKPTYTTGGKFAISAYAEPFMSRSTFRANDTSLAFSGNYTENRRQQETWSFGFAAGVQGEFRLMKNLYLSAGLGYQYMQNRETTNVPMQYFQTVESLNYDTLTFTTPYGNDTTVIFSFTSTYSSLVQDTLRPVYTNSFQYMEIPIQLGYQFRLSSVVGLRMNVGVSPGILLYSRNLQYDPANSGLIQAQGGESQAARFMLNATAGLEFNFRVANQVSLFAGPSARIGVTSLFDRNAVIRQTPFTIGLKTGFRYQF